MSAYAKFSLTAAFGVLAAFAVYVLVATENGLLLEQSASGLALMIVSYFVIFALIVAVQQVVGIKLQNEVLGVDEREKLLDLRAEQWGYRAYDLAIIILLALVVAEKAIGVDWLGSFTFTRAEGLAFALIATTTLVSVARMLGAIYMEYRS